MSPTDYSTQEGKLLVAAVDGWNGKSSGWVAMNPLFDQLGIPRERGDAMVSEWKRRGWGEVYWDRAAPSFIPEGEGLRMADVWREKLRQPTVKERVKKVPFGKGTWEVIKLALAALIGAAVAHIWK